MLPPFLSAAPNTPSTAAPAVTGSSPATSTTAAQGVLSAAVLPPGFEHLIAEEVRRVLQVAVASNAAPGTAESPSGIAHLLPGLTPQLAPALSLDGGNDLPLPTDTGGEALPTLPPEAMAWPWPFLPAMPVHAEPTGVTMALSAPVSGQPGATPGIVQGGEAFTADVMRQFAGALQGQTAALRADGLTARAEEAAIEALSTPEVAPAVESPVAGLSPAMTGMTPLNGVDGALATARSAAALHIERPVGSPGWGQELAQRVQWVVGKEMQSAEIRINPPHLGPIELRVTMHNDQAHVVLVTASPAVREAVEQALPRLRELLADNGISLGHAGVADHSGAGMHERRPERPDMHPAGEGGSSDPAPVVASGVSAVRVVPAGRIDFFA